MRTYRTGLTLCHEVLWNLQYTLSPTTIGIYKSHFTSIESIKKYEKIKVT